MGVSDALVFSTWRDADPPCPLSGLVEPLPPDSPASDISWTLTRRETVRPWDPKAQPGGFQKTARSATGFTTPLLRDPCCCRFQPSVQSRRFTPPVKEVHTYDPEMPSIVSCFAGLPRRMNLRLRSGLNKAANYAHRFAFSPPPLASGKFGDFLLARSRTLVSLARGR